MFIQLNTRIKTAKCCLWCLKIILVLLSGKNVKLMFSILWKQRIKSLLFFFFFFWRYPEIMEMLLTGKWISACSASALGLIAFTLLTGWSICLERRTRLGQSACLSVRERWRVKNKENNITNTPTWRFRAELHTDNQSWRSTAANKPLAQGHLNQLWEVDRYFLLSAFNHHMHIW